MREKTEEITEALRPYEICFKGLDYVNKFFRALFIRADETQAVMEANDLARKIFGIKTERPYMPQMSLFYGNLPVETKKLIIAHLGDSPGGSFKVRRIHLFSTSGQTGDWYEVASFPVL